MLNWPPESIVVMALEMDGFSATHSTLIVVAVSACIRGAGGCDHSTIASEEVEEDETRCFHVMRDA